jgi:hypothetical protein
MALRRELEKVSRMELLALGMRPMELGKALRMELLALETRLMALVMLKPSGLGVEMGVGMGEKGGKASPPHPHRHRHHGLHVGILAALSGLQWDQSWVVRLRADGRPWRLVGSLASLVVQQQKLRMTQAWVRLGLERLRWVPASLLVSELGILLAQVANEVEVEPLLQQHYQVSAEENKIFHL